jgi:serine/threonine-protein kinase RsbW
VGSVSGSLIELEVPARAEYLALVRRVVAAAAELDARVAPDRIDDLRLAVSEATTNAIRAHTQLGTTERIAIRCNLDLDRVEVEVRDHGDGFTGDLPDRPIAIPPGLAREGGYGLPLMRVLADRMEVRSMADGVVVSLVVYTTPR